jgi:transcriptional antiterminator NusG
LTKTRKPRVRYVPVTFPPGVRCWKCDGMFSKRSVVLVDGDEKRCYDCAKRWYVIGVWGGATVERKVRRTILRDKNMLMLDKYVGRSLVPTKKQMALVMGQRVVQERRKFPGYVLVEMIPTPDALSLVLTAARIGAGNLLPSNEDPHPLTDEEADRVLREQEHVKATRGQSDEVRLDFGPGSAVKIRSGAFEGQVFRVRRIEGPPADPKIIVEVSLMGMKTEMALGHAQARRTEESPDD